MKTPIANMITDMHSAGIPVETIIRSVATLEEAMAAKAVSTGIPADTSMMEKRRAWDRERKRKQAAARNSTGIPPDHSTGIPPENPCILIREKKEEAIQEEVEGKKESKKRDTRARGSRIPPDFSIDNADRAFAAALGIPPETVEAETPQFIDYWSSVAGAKGVKLDWKATWRNRMRDLKKYQPTNSRTSNGYRSANPRKTGHDAILAAAAREARKIIGDGELAERADEAEFPFGDGSDRGTARGYQGSAGTASPSNDGGKPFSGGVLEGEIISPDEANARLPGGWRVVG